MSRIELNVVATGNFRNLETSLSRLRAQVNALNASFLAGRGSDAGLSLINNYVQGFEKAIDASGMFERHMVNVTSETNRFGRSLQSGNLRMNQLFRSAVDYRRGELGQIRQLAREQVRLQNATVMRMPDGRSQVIVPRGIDEAIDKQRILNQEYRIFRQVVQNGSTEIINWGKNTQWAGRQLTVGLTVPLTIFGATAGKMFMDADKQLVRLAKVYGDATKGMVDPKELDSIRQKTLELGQELAATMGIAASETMGIAADLAATGKEGNELIDSTREAMRLSVLGEVDRQEAMRATLSIQSVFKKDTEGLAESINFLNAVENQTSTSLNDLVTGIVKAGPVVQGLGGDIEDLAMMMVAMREGGIPASEAANAIKSSLASLINPTKQTRDVLQGFGIDLVDIVDKNAGDVIGTLVDLQSELEGLNELSRQRAIEQIFGKFQFSRINAMLSNIGKAGSQTEQVMAIAGMSVSDLAQTAELELSAMTESVSGKFGRALESLKANLIPIGEVFVQVGTMLMNVGNKILEVFNSLPEPVKNLINGLGFITALAGPLIMITGVLGNFFGYIVKGISSFMALKQAGRGMFEVFTPESVAAARATETLTESMFDQKIAMSEMSSAVQILIEKLEQLVQQLNDVKSSSSGMKEALANAEASVFSGSPNEPRGSLLFHRLPKSTLEGPDRGTVSVASVFSKEYNDINQALGDTLVPVLSGIADIDEPAMQAVIDKLARSEITLNPEQKNKIFLPVAKAAEEAAAPAAYPGAFARMREAGATPEQIKRTELQFRQSYASDPKLAIKQLSQEFEAFGVSLSGEVTQIKNELENAYRQALESGATIEQATEAMYRKSAEIETAARSKVDDIISFPTKDDGQPRKRSGTAGQLMLQEGISLLGIDPSISEEVKNATKREIEIQNKKNQIDQEILANKQEQKRLEQEIKELKKTEKARNKRILEIQSKPVAQRTDEEKAELGRLTRERKKLSDKTARLAVVTGESTQLEELSQQTQQELTIAQEQKTEAVKRSVQSEKEEVISSEKNQVSEDIDTVNTMDSARSEKLEADSSKRLAAAENADAAATGRGGGILRGGKLGMGISALSMGAMFLPTGDPNTGAGQAMGAVQDVATFTGMGAMFGPPGMAIGAGIGVLKAGFDFLGRKAEESAKELENFKKAVEANATGLIDAEREFLGIQDRLLGAEDVPLASFGTKTGEAISALDAFVEALRNAEDGTLEKGRVDALKATGSAQEYIQSPAFQKMISESLAAGASPEAIRSLVEGLLIASDKQGYAFEVNQELTRILEAGNTNQERLAKYLESQVSSASAMEKIPEADRESLNFAQENYNKLRINPETGLPQNITMDGMPVDIFDLGTHVQKFFAESDSPISEEEFMRWMLGDLEEGTPRTEQINKFMHDLMRGLEFDGEQAQAGDSRAKEMLDMAYNLASIYGDKMPEIASSMEQVDVANSLMVDNLINGLARGGESLDEFLSSLSIGTVNTFNESSLAIDEIKNRLSGVEVGGKEAAGAFQDIINAGANTTQALQILSMMIKDAGTDWQQLASIASTQPAVFTIIWEQFVSGPSATPGAVAAQGATASEDVGQRLAGTIDWSGGGGAGGGGADTSAIDAQIEAQDKLIEKIKEEREERQKLLNLEKEAFDFAMREQDLKNQIAEARAEGRMADAALLQSQLDGERKAERQKEAERVRQEQEDRRIERAEKEKERLQEKKDSMSGGGGGGGGASGPSQQQQQWAANRIEILSSGVVNWTEGAELRRATLEKGPWSAFFESDKVKSYREELTKLGVPVEEIDAELNSMFDSWIENNKELFGQTEEYKFVEGALKNMGVEAENLKQVMPDAFSALLDKELTKTEQIDIISDALYDLGYETDEARKKAEKLYRQYNENEFETEGIDEEIQRWIDFNDTIKRAQKQLELYQTGKGGPVSADQAERTAQVAAGQTPGVPPPTVNAGGMMVDPAQIAKDAQVAGAAIPSGIKAGVDSGSQAASDATGSMITQLVQRAKDLLGIESPSKVFQEIGMNALQGFALGVTDGQGYSSIETAFSTMTDSVTQLIHQGFIDLPSEVTPEIQKISDVFYNTMTEGINKTVDEINRIVSTGIKDYEFKIQGMPGVYIPQDLDGFWQTALPGVYNKLSTYGQIYRAQGGYVSGPGGPTEDKIPAWLSDGEYVIRASSVSKYGMDLLNQINAGRFADGGYVTISNNTSPLGQSIATYAQQFTGTPYSANSYNSSTGPDGEGWGCATAMYWLYKNHFGISLPDTSLSANQWSGLSREVDWESMLPGDLMYFYNPTGVNRGNPVNHTGMYVGNNQMFHASAPGIGTIVSSLGDQYRSQFRGARRVVPETEIGLQFPRRYKMGGKVYGNGGPAQDNILAMLSNGEYVMNAMSVRKYGQEFMDALNKGELAEAAAGGLMSKYPGVVARMSMGGSVKRYGSGGMVSGNNSNIEYNINVNVEGTNSSADEIANQVLKAMKQRDYMNRSVTRI